MATRCSSPAPGRQPSRPLLYQKLKYDPLLKLDPVIQIASAPGLLLVRNGLPVKTLDDLIKLSKQSPGKLNMASAGNGSLQQLIGEFSSCTKTSNGRIFRSAAAHLPSAN